MNLENMEQAIRESEAVLENADKVATRLARILRGRLRRVGICGLLNDLKRELRDWDMHKRRWTK